ncbi:TPA: hypothetical protein NV714_000211 [Escherichia coli]|nr:hypothetical protein [Escherichia coli]
MKKLAVVMLSAVMMVSSVQSAHALSKNGKIALGVIGGLTIGYLGAKAMDKNKEQENARYNEQNYNNQQQNSRCRVEKVYRQTSNNTFVPVEMKFCDRY